MFDSITILGVTSLLFQYIINRMHYLVHHFLLRRYIYDFMTSSGDIGELLVRIVLPTQPEEDGTARL